jgi:S-phase kinase-associated protein 1
MEQVDTTQNNEIDDESLTKMVTLVSSDGIKVELTKKSAMRSNLLKGLLEDYDYSTPIPLPEVNGEILKHIVGFLDHFKNSEPTLIPLKPHPLRSLKDVTSEWEADWIEQFPWETVEDIIIASNYMDIPPILHLSCAKIASLMKRKTADEIREMFNMGPCDIPEEELHDLDEFQMKEDD